MSETFLDTTDETVPVRDLITIAAESATGTSPISTIDIVGEFGHVLVTGDVKESAAFPGYVIIETEVGTLLIDVDAEITYRPNAT